MNKPDEPRDRLLAELFHESWDEGVPAQLAKRAAASARRRRTARKAALGVVAAIAMAALLKQAGPSVVSVSPRKEPVAGAAKPAYEIMSDEELMLRLRDRPLLIVQNERGAREIILIDAK